METTPRSEDEKPKVRVWKCDTVHANGDGQRCRAWLMWDRDEGWVPKAYETWAEAMAAADSEIEIRRGEAVDA